MSRYSERDGHFATVRGFIRKAKDERVNSNDFDDASRALQKIGIEKNDLECENTALKSEFKQLCDLMEQRERDLVGIREQGPQAVKDQFAAKLSAENEKLRQELKRITTGGQPSSPTLYQLNEEQRDPFPQLLGDYLRTLPGAQLSTERQVSRPPLNEIQQGVSTCAFNEQMNNEATQAVQSTAHNQTMGTQEETVVNAGLVAQQKRRVRRCHSASSVSLFTTSPPPVRHERKTAGPNPVSGQGPVQYHNPRRHSEITNPLVMSAGVAAQRRRSRRCQSASAISQSRRSSLKHFVDMLNSITNEEGQMSWLASLVVHLLVTAHRPIEAHNLKQLLKNPTTSSKTEEHLHYTVIRDLVAKLQSPHSAPLVWNNVNPSLLESTSNFLQMVAKQRPVVIRRYSSPIFM